MSAGPSRRRVLAVLASALAAPQVAVAAAEKKKGGGLSYIQFPTLTATVRRVDGRRGVLSLEAGVDVPNSGLHARADASQPILRDAYLRWLTIYAAALTPQSAPDADEIHDQLQRITDRVLGRPGATLLVGTVMVN